jgi:preprotein translocase subunit YajC
MDAATVANLVTNLGVVPGLLLLFVFYFLRQDKKRDEQWGAQVKSNEDRIEQQFKSFHERENILIAESTRREELMRQESDKREKIQRDEAEKREGFLMRTIEGFSGTMKEISEAMIEIKVAQENMADKVDKIENVIDKGRRYDGTQSRGCESEGIARKYN